MKSNNFFNLIFIVLEFFLILSVNISANDKNYFEILPYDINLIIFENLLIEKDQNIIFLEDINNSIKCYANVSKLFKNIIYDILIKYFGKYKFDIRNRILYFAIDSNYNYCALFLIKNFIDVNYIDERNNNLMSYLASKNKKGLLKLLIVLFHDKFKWSIVKEAFIKAIVHSRVYNIEILMVLINYLDAKYNRFKYFILNVRDCSGSTPLMYAVEHRLNSVIELLIDNGANMEITNNLNQNCIDIARAYGYDETFRLLLRKNRDKYIGFNFIDQEV